MMPTVFRRLGLPGVLGLLLVAGAAWVQWRWLPQQTQQAEQQASRARQLRHELLSLEQKRLKPDEVQLTPDAAWQAVWQQLPDASQRTVLQGMVLTSARDRGLILAAVQFKGAPEGPAGLWRQRLTLPVEGRYVDVRAWLVQLMGEPALSLDALDLQRTDVMGDTIKARISVSLWWRMAGGVR